MSEAGASLTELTVIIVSYNTREMTLECLGTLLAQLLIDPEIIVVDNGSADGTVAAIRERHPQVYVIENPANTGFGAANNLAMARARGRFFLLLNSDAFPRAGAVETLIEAMRAHPKAGVVGPRLVYPDGSAQQSVYPFPSPATAWRENLGLARFGGDRVDYRQWTAQKDTAVPWIIGACMLVRREAYVAAGGFDERFFMYQEEADWQKRIAAADWEIWVIPTAEVMHVAGASGKAETARVSRVFFESLDLFMAKHHGRAGLLATRAAMVIGCSARGLIWSVLSIVPGLRRKAAPRARLQRWLAWRQLTAPLPA